MAFCAAQIVENLAYLADDYGERTEALAHAEKLQARLIGRTISEIFDEGLHEFLSSVLNDTGALAYQIETDYRFNA